MRSLASLHVNPRAPANSYLRQLFKSLIKFDVLDSYLHVITTSGSPSWRPHKVSVDIEELAAPKHNWFPHELKHHFMHKLCNYSRVQAVHVYCDGSVDGSKSGCGLFIHNYTSPSDYTDTEVSKRLPGNLSSTRAELYVILEGLQIVLPLGKDAYFFVDSQGALYSLLSPCPADGDLTNKCVGVIDLLERDNLRVHFTWLPSHVGIPLHEQADDLARHSLTEDIATCPIDHTYNNIKGQLRHHVCSTIAYNPDTCYENGSPTSIMHMSPRPAASPVAGRVPPITLLLCASGWATATIGRSVGLLLCPVGCITVLQDRLLSTTSWSAPCWCTSAHRDIGICHHSSAGS